MTALNLPDPSVQESAHGPAVRLPVALFVVALVYGAAALLRAPDVAVLERGYLLPLRLFSIAAAPAIAGIVFLWSERAIGDAGRRRLARSLVLMLCGLAGLAAVSGLPW